MNSSKDTTQTAVSLFIWDNFDSRDVSLDTHVIKSVLLNVCHRCPSRDYK